MRKHRAVWVSIFFTFACSGLVYGKDSNLFRHFKVDIPPQIDRVTAVGSLRPYLQSNDQMIRNAAAQKLVNLDDPSSVDALLPFLESHDMAFRMAAARKLGELGDPSAVPLLVKCFEKEPYSTGVDASQPAKSEIITALRKIGTDEAKQALVNIAKQYWTNGPQTPNKRYEWADGDYLHNMPLVLDALKGWSQDDAVFNLSSAIALEKEFRSKLASKGGWELYLRGKMIREGIVNEKESVKYLADFLLENGSDGKSFHLFDASKNTLRSIKTTAVDNILQGYGQEAFSVIEDEMQKTPRDNMDRRYVLSHIRGQIRKGMEARSGNN